MPSPASSVNVLRSNGVERARYVGRFATNGASSPTSIYCPGLAVTAARIGVGATKITIPAGVVSSTSLNPTVAGRRLIGLEAFLSNGLAAPTPGSIRIGQSAFNSDGSFHFDVYTFDSAGAAADIAADPNNHITFAIEVEER